MSGEVDWRQVVASCAIVGVIIGVLGAIPIIRWPNLCCLWVILGGFAVAYINGRNEKSMETADAAILGAVFGIIYGIIVNFATFIINIPLTILGLGVAARGVAGGGLLNTLGIKLGMNFVGGIFLIILNILEGVIFGAVGGVLYAVSRGGEYGQPGGSKGAGLLETDPKRGRKSTLGKI